MRKYLTLFLCLVMAFNSISVAFAFPGFSTDEETSKEGFASAFGWDQESIDADEWTNEDGDTYRRMTSHQQEKFYDALKSAQDYALKLGIIKARSDVVDGYGGYKIAAVAKNEIGAEGSWETPPYSNRVKYNDYHSAAWCASFVSWCAAQCGYVDSGLFEYTAWAPGIYSYQVYTNGFNAYPLYSVTQFGGSEYSACVGDIIIFQDGAHVGIVTDVDSNSIEVTHGNGTSGDGLDGVRADWMGADRFSVSWSNWRLNNCSLIHVEYPSPISYGMDFNGDTEAVLYEVYWFCKNTLHLNNAAIAAICGNIEAESGFNPGSIGDLDCGVAIGLIQWNGERRLRLQDWCLSNGYDPNTVNGQMMYLFWELRDYGHYLDTYNVLTSIGNSADDAYYAAEYFCRYFERPRYPDSESVKRGSWARDKYFPMFEQGMSLLPPGKGNNSSGSGSGGTVKPKPGIGDQPIIIPE